MTKALLNKIVLLAFMLLMMGMARAQVAGGTYSIGSTGDYATLNAAVADINTNGISGNVTLEFEDGHVEDAYNVFNYYSGSDDYELVIRPEAGATSVELIRSTNGKILDFIGARNIIVDGRPGGVGSSVMTLTNNSTSGGLAGISFEGQSRFITIKHVNIVYMGVGIRTVGGGINDPENITIENCVFSTPEINITVSNMIALNHNCVTTSNMTVRNNVFKSPNVGTGSITNYTAMYIRSGAEVYNNMIAVGDIPVENVYGIRTNYGNGMNFDHNTIAFSGGSTSSTSIVGVYPFYFQHAGTVTLSNNLIYNAFDCGTGCTRASIVESSTYGGDIAAEYNTFGITYSPDATNAYYILDGVSTDLIAEFPNNSLIAHTEFNFVDFENNDLSLEPTATFGFRTTSPTRTTDITGAIRGVDLATRGAAEADFLDTDNNIYGFSAPEAYSVSLTDFGSSGRINVVIENPTTDLTFTPTIALATGATVDPESGVLFDYSRVVNYTVYFNVTASNGTSSKIWLLNVSGVNRWPAGTYSVGAGLDFEDLEEASNSIGVFGIDGDVILELEDGYSGNWTSIFSGPGVDEHTITIRPEAGATAITAYSASTGGKNMILDGRPGGVGESVLTFRSLNFATLSLGEYEAAVRYVNFLDNLSASTSAIYGLRIYGWNSSVSVENCVFTTPNGTAHKGILNALLVMHGANITIKDNQFYEIKHSPGISNAKVYGIEVRGVTGKTEIINNAMSLKPEKFAPFHGIRLTSSVTGEVDIFHNTVVIEDSGTADQTGTYTGIEVEGDPSTLNIKNNIVSNTSPGTRRGIIVGSGGVGVHEVDYNNVSGTLPFTYASGITSAVDFKSSYSFSSTVDVTFTDTSTGDMSLSNSFNNNSQVRTIFDAGVAADINGTLRGDFPLKGAYDAEGSGFNDILNLTFENSDDLVIDADAAEVAVTAHPDTDLTSLALDILLPPGATIAPDPAIARDFTSPVDFTVTSDDDVDKVWTVSISYRNVAPEGLTLSSPEVDENVVTGTIVSVLLPYDPNTGDSHDFDLVSGEGDTDNAWFYINDNILYTNSFLNHEVKDVRTVRIEVTDQDGLSSAFIKEIAINDINDAPDDIYLDNEEFDEEIEAGTIITTIYVDDEDEGDTYTVEFVSGDGDTDNAKFSIAPNETEGYDLTTLVVLDYEEQEEYFIRLKATDSQGLTLEYDFVIYVYDVAEDPTDILLSATSIDENNAINDEVGLLSTVDDDIADTHTYALVSGDGDDDNLSFAINEVDQSIVAKEVFDFETKNSYSIRIQTDDNNGGVFEKVIEITINNVNEAPSELLLTNNTLDESSPIGTLVGVLSTTDIDIEDTHTYTITDECASCGPNGTDNFQIVGNELRSNGIFDYESENSFTIEITSTDAGGLTVAESFTISINDLPAQVTSITLSNSAIDENEVSGTLVGTFETFGEDLSGSYTYTFATGTGDDDNGSFTISGNQLLTAESFNFEAKNSYSVLVMSDDGVQSGTKVFTIAVNDISEAPTDLALSNNTITENNVAGEVIGLFTTTDEDTGESFTYNLAAGSGDTDNASFLVVGDELQANAVFDFETKATYSVRVATNDGNGGTFEKVFMISIGDENESILVTGPIADFNLDEGFGTHDIDLSTVFTDQDGDELTFEVISNNTDVVTVSNSVSILTITEVGGFGSATITVTADDGSGVTNSHDFMVTVVDVNEAPVVANAIGNQSQQEGFGSLQVSYAGVFTDGDGDVLTIGVLSSETGVVTATIIEGELIEFTEVGLGTSTITLSADDERGGEVEMEFSFTVTEIPNTPPVVANEMADDAADEGFGTIQISYADVFTDADGDELTISVLSSEISVVTAAVIEGTLIEITEAGLGSSVITLTADDNRGGVVSTNFIFTVTELPNNTPVVVNTIADDTQQEGFGTVQISYAGVFTDADDDVLTISVESSETDVVTAAIIEGGLIEITEVGIGSSIITITADDGNGGTVSDEFTFTVTGAPLGLGNEIELAIYPNPTSDYLNVESDRSMQVRLTDLNGHILKTGEGRAVKMELGSFADGVYLIIIEQEGQSIRKRIIKAN